MRNEKERVKAGCLVSHDRRCDGDGEGMPGEGDPGAPDTGSQDDIGGLRTCMVFSGRDGGKTAAGDGRSGN